MKEFVLLSFEEGHRLVYSAILITNGCIRGCHVVASLALNEVKH